MYVTLSGGIVNALLDPLLIFSAGLGLDGAALASVAARLAVMCVGLYGVIKVHKMVDKSSFSSLLADIPAISAIAAPAILTNVATPVGNAYATAVIADFGDGPGRRLGRRWAYYPGRLRRGIRVDRCRGSNLGSKSRCSTLRPLAAQLVRCAAL